MRCGEYPGQNRSVSPFPLLAGLLLLGSLTGCAPPDPHRELYNTVSGIVVVLEERKELDFFERYLDPASTNFLKETSQFDYVLAHFDERRTILLKALKAVEGREAPLRGHRPPQVQRPSLTTVKRPRVEEEAVFDVSAVDEVDFPELVFGRIGRHWYLLSTTSPRGRPLSSSSDKDTDKSE